MRVVAGTARSLQLKTVPGKDTRPTLDRIKETLFNIIQNDVPGGTFCDLFAGSGGIGIEALSRGATEACFVEQAKAAVDVIRENLAHTKFEDRAKVYAMDACAAIAVMEGEGRYFDVVFMDPPYGQEHERRVLTRLADSDLIDEDSLIIVEANLETDYSYVNALDFEVCKVKVYKSNQHIFLRKRSAA